MKNIQQISRQEAQALFDQLSASRAENMDLIWLKQQVMELLGETPSEDRHAMVAQLQSELYKRINESEPTRRTHPAAATATRTRVAAPLFSRTSIRQNVIKFLASVAMVILVFLVWLEWPFISSSVRGLWNSEDEPQCSTGEDVRALKLSLINNLGVMDAENVKRYTVLKGKMNAVDDVVRNRLNKRIEALANRVAKLEKELATQSVAQTAALEKMRKTIAANAVQQKVVASQAQSAQVKKPIRAVPVRRSVPMYR